MKQTTQDNINLLVGQRIAELRKKKGLTLEKLAYENDLSKSTLSRIECGKVDARISNLERIAAGLDISLKELFDHNSFIESSERLRTIVWG
ncbi:MAG: helix-turn-helix domain-containing protein [Candidatus Margulisbacteria bacterium]|jgi:transcriptional regulator with XRE-family HTH domain|nr:helix-turn-helix domain-containing protein [Candidatus Margulisiibacteriota bacterium]